MEGGLEAVIKEGEEGGVHYHEDRCTKNKRMFQIPMHGFIFNLHRELFLFWTHIN